MNMRESEDGHHKHEDKVQLQQQILTLTVNEFSIIVDEESLYQIVQL